MTSMYEIIRNDNKGIKNIEEYDRELSASYDSHESFYGKATETVYLNANGKDELGIVMKSYNIPICYLNYGTGKMKIMYAPNTQTTARHFREFCKQHGFDHLSDLPLVKLRELDDMVLGRNDDPFKNIEQEGE